MPELLEDEEELELEELVDVEVVGLRIDLFVIILFLTTGGGVVAAFSTIFSLISGHCCEIGAKINVCLFGRMKFILVVGS